MFTIISVADKLPPIIARKDVGRLLGGVIAPKTLANRDALGIGPKARFNVGRTVCYETASLLDLVQELATSDDQEDSNA